MFVSMKGGVCLFFCAVLASCGADTSEFDGEKIKYQFVTKYYAMCLKKYKDRKLPRDQIVLKCDCSADYFEENISASQLFQLRAESKKARNAYLTRKNDDMEKACGF